MRAVWVDPAGRTARVQGGALWGDVDHETQAHDLATTGGIVVTRGSPDSPSAVEWASSCARTGRTVDNLLSAELVTAEGSVGRASADEHPITMTDRLSTSRP